VFFVSNAIVFVTVMVSIRVKKSLPLLIYVHQSQILVSVFCLRQAFMLCSDCIICLEVVKLFLEQIHQSIKRSVPKVIRMILLRSAEGPGKESGRRGRWRGNPGIQLDLPQLSPHLCSSRYVSKVHCSFVSCHGGKCRGVWSSVM